MKKQTINNFFFIILILLLTSIFTLFFTSCSSDDNTQPETNPSEQINEAPLLEAQTFTVAEDIADDVIIGTISATDAENDPLTITITQNDTDLFEVTEAGALSLAPGKGLDFEKTDSHQVTIQVSDGTNTTNAVITIIVENVGKPFVTTWTTTTANEEITFYINTNFIYDYTIDWGDGTIENNKTIAGKHVYATAGTYTVSISGMFPAFSTISYDEFSTEQKNIGISNASKLQTIEAWGDIEWKSMNFMFFGCVNMTYKAIDIPDLSMVSETVSMFGMCSKFNGNLSRWDVSNVTNMGGMFADATSFNSDVKQWDVSKVTNMIALFENATSFNGNLSAWNVSNVTNMTGMLNNTKIPVLDYDDLLNAWAARPNLQLNVTLGAEGLLYCSSTRARNTLINDKGWTIIGDSDVGCF